MPSALGGRAALGLATLLLAPAAAGVIPPFPDSNVLAVWAFCAAEPRLPDNDTWRYAERFCRNLATARAAADLKFNEFNDPLAYGVALVSIATSWEAEVLRVRLDGVGQTSHDAPSEAALEVLELAEVPAEPDIVERLRTYDALPEPARGALTRLLDAFLALHAASSRGHGEIFSARATFLDATAALAPAVRALGEDERPVPVAVPKALALDLRATQATYTDDFLFLLDAGGDDVYLNNAGGNGFTCAECPHGAAPVAAAALVDLDGRDRYGTPRGFGQNGGAMYGVGLLVDAAGDDAYVSNHFGTNGAACIGIALLLDAGGDDLYEAGAYYTNGGGESDGAGLLVDVAGDDVYRSPGDSANGGATAAGGVGFLLDAAGHDAYLAASGGANGGARYGGQGFLLDLAGDDTYLAESLGVNGAGLFLGDPLLELTEDAPFGFLYDAAGRDRYEDTETQHSNGSGSDRTVAPKGAGAQVDAPWT